MLIILLIVGITMSLGALASIWVLKKVSEVPTGVSPVMKKFKTWEYDDEPNKNTR